MNTNVVNNPKSVMEIIQNTKPQEIAALDFVKQKYIQNYNASNKDKNGELMYHRNMVYFNQLISANDQLKNADKFSLYACLVTAAVKNYSLDPADNDVYLIARGGKATLSIQAGAHVKRLIRTEQIVNMEQAKLVYKGDVFEVEAGRVQRHVEKFETDIIIAGYVRVIIDETGRDLYFIYRPSDWQAWQRKSSNPNTIEKNGQNGKYLSKSLWDNETLGGTQPEPGFLRTKIIKHACNEKCWASGMAPIMTECYDVEIEEDIVELPKSEAKPSIAIAPAEVISQIDNGSFMEEKAPQAGVTFDSDDENF